MQVGIPAGLQGVLFSVSNVVIQSSINSFGEVVMAGNGAANHRGIGYNVVPMVVTLLVACAFRLVWIATVFQIPRFHTIETIDKWSRGAQKV